MSASRPTELGNPRNCSDVGMKSTDEHSEGRAGKSNTTVMET